MPETKYIRRFYDSLFRIVITKHKRQIKLCQRPSKAFLCDQFSFIYNSINQPQSIRSSMWVHNALCQGSIPARTSFYYSNTLSRFRSCFACTEANSSTVVQHTRAYCDILCAFSCLEHNISFNIGKWTWEKKSQSDSGSACIISK